MLAPNQWLREYGPGYRHLTRAERTAVSDFVMLWSVYEARVLACNATAARMKEVIDRWNDSGLLSGDRSNDSWDHFLERLRDNDEVSYRFSSLRFANQADKDFVRHAVLAKAPGPDLLMRHKAMALIVHRIRNNLLHGEKWSYGLQGQEANFRHSSHMLMVWMDMDRSLQAPFGHADT